MFGVNLSTAGRVSISDVRFEVVGKDVPLGAHGPRSVQ
jgi:hypothetical protein